MGEALRTGNSNDHRIHGPGGPGFSSRGEVDEGTKGIDSFLLLTNTSLICEKGVYYNRKVVLGGASIQPDH